MQMEINAIHPEYAKIKKIVNLLKNNGIIVYPTDTIYGLGCNIFSPAAIEKIYKIKKKKATGFSFVLDKLDDVAKYAIVPDSAYKIMKKVLPGPYTFVFKATTLVPKEIIPDKKTVAIRIPDCPISLAIVKELGHPIVSTSVNLHGEPYFSDPLKIEKLFGDKVDMVIDAGLLDNEPSTVIDFSSGDPQLIRLGKGDVSSFMQIN